MKKPIWIVVDGGDFFEGNQLHWADCFFSNACQSVIEDFCESEGCTVEIRDMTDEEIARFPEIVAFVEQLEASKETK